LIFIIRIAELVTGDGGSSSRSGKRTVEVFQEPPGAETTGKRHQSQQGMAAVERGWRGEAENRRLKSKRQETTGQSL
jgi:hypothetical protein